jgi:hypothetical protein
MSDSQNIPFEDKNIQHDLDITSASADNLSPWNKVRSSLLIKKPQFIVVPFLLLVLVGVGFYFFSANKTKTNIKLLPYETILVPTNPQEKFEQIITSNPIYTQINIASNPVVPIVKEHDLGAQTMLSLKTALSSNNIKTSEPNSTKQQMTITLDGAISASASGDTQDFSLKGSLLRLTQDAGDKSLVDLIVNGSIGSTMLDDEYQDALHISLTQTDSDNSYLKVHMSDYLLIFTDRLLHPNKAVSPTIFVNTNDIWPFLGQYLHIPRSIELLRFGDSLDQEVQDRFKLIREESSLVFSETLGNINLYMEINQSQEKDESTVFNAAIIPEKLVDVIADYIAGVKGVESKYIEDFRLLCETTSLNKEERSKCEADLVIPAYSQENFREELIYLVSLFKFDPIKATINNDTLFIENFSFGVIFSNKLNAGLWEIPIPFSELSLQIDTNILNSTKEPILAPKNSTELVSAGNNTDSFTDATYQEQSIQGDLYRENKQLLLSSYNDIKHFCGGLLGQEYCFEASSKWSDFAISKENRNSLRLTLKSADPSNYKTSSIGIEQSTTNSFISKCTYSDSPKEHYGISMTNYSEIITADGFKLRLSEPENLSDFETTYYYVCSVRDGVYYNSTPYGKITINPGVFNFEELIRELSPIVSSLSLTDSSSSFKFAIPTPISSPTISPTYSFSTPVRKVLAGDSMWVYFYGTGMGGDQDTCYASSAFLKEKYQVGDEAVFVVPPDYGICVRPKGCAVCSGGELIEPISDLSSCAKQICE